jgi:hypothetical protein
MDDFNDQLKKFDELFPNMAPAETAPSASSPPPSHEEFFNELGQSADLLKKYDEVQQNPKNQSPTYKLADTITEWPANNKDASAVAAYNPEDQRGHLLDAVHELGSQKKRESGGGFVRKAAARGYVGVTNLEEAGLRMIGLDGLSDDQRRYAYQLKSAWERLTPYTILMPIGMMLASRLLMRGRHLHKCLLLALLVKWLKWEPRR